MSEAATDYVTPNPDNNRTQCRFISLFRVEYTHTEKDVRSYLLQTSLRILVVLTGNETNFFVRG